MKNIRDTKMGEKSGFETFLNSKIFKTLWTSLYLIGDKIKSNIFFYLWLNLTLFFNDMKILIDSWTIFGLYIWNICHWIIFYFHVNKLYLNVFHHHNHNLYMRVAKLFLFCPANHEICIILKKMYFILLFIQMAFKKSRNP